MSSSQYEWPRFWCPRDGAFSLSDGGYLADPTSEYGRLLNPQVRAFPDLAGTQCLVFLGEPGMGKSTSVKSGFDAASQRADGSTALLLDLRRYGTEDRLLRELTESQVMREWANSESVLELFLDSVDECLLRVDTLATLLPDALHQLPTHRLLLRIACRTGDWPQTLEAGLDEVFGKASLGVYELTPLRRIDVASAATAKSLEPEAFLREIAELEAQALANRPITLEFLLRTKGEGKDLPRRKIDLYSLGCAILSAENNQARREAKLSGHLGAAQRVRVASRIAAATVFANHYAVWMGSEAGPVPPEDLTVGHLLSGVPGAEEISNEELEETIGTGLFSSRGPNRMGWTHQTYAEFLAGCWVRDSKLDLAQILGLLTSPHDPEKRLVPQLHETAAWVAIMRPDAFQALVELDPEVLLRGDIAAADVDHRRKLAQALLDGYGAERIVDRDWDLRFLYHKLAHPDLADQLRPYVVDKGAGAMVRRVAINMAEACNLKSLQAELIGLALDGAEPHGLRHAAASAAASVSDAEHLLHLRPLLQTTLKEDPDDQLRGYALAALWPEHLAADELFGALHQPRDPSLYGSYKAFIRSVLPQSLSDDHLPIALDWVVQQEPSRRATTDVIEGLADHILIRVWRSGPTGQIRAKLAEVVLRRRREYLPIIGSEHQQELSELLQETPEARKTFVVALLQCMSAEDDVWSLWNSGPNLIDQNCLSWLLDWLVHGDGSQDAKARAADAVRHLYDPNKANDISAVLEAAARSSTLASVMAPYFDAVELGSSQAREMKVHHEKQLARAREQQEWQIQHFKPVDPPPQERVRICLERCEAGSLDGFWHLASELTLKSDTRHYEGLTNPDVTALPGWLVADAETRARIVEAARRYILRGDPNTADWLGKDVWHLPALAGYKALWLLSALDPEFIAKLPADVWTRWGPVIVVYPHLADQNDPATHRSLVSKVYHLAPDVTLDALYKSLDASIAKHGAVFDLERFDECWDNRLSRSLFHKALEPATKPRAFQQLLSSAVSHGLAEAEAYARAMLDWTIGQDGLTRERSVSAATVLLLHAPGRSWEFVQGRIEGDEDFGRKLVSAMANEQYAPMLRELPEQELADLYVWLSQRYPDSEDPESDGWVGPVDQIARFRNAILNALKTRGTFEASRAIEKIIEQLPSLSWLKYALHDARATARARTWHPPSASEVLSLQDSTKGRLVRSGGELLDAIIASLQRLGKNLQGETPAGPDLWNGPDSTKHYRPKDEEHLSNYIKRHLEKDLKQRGVVVNREVQIRRGEGNGLGERTDIRIDAVVRDARVEDPSVLTVIVEVKGCWHSELDTAMGTQLVGRYLKDNACRHGLYLVGWYNCQQWDSADPKCRASAGLEIDEIKEQLRVQAESLSVADLELRAFVLNAALR